ncbi:unnamed protein product [Rhizophagus irregularis]|uniref:Uncharacterized protein n=1 Tax=Rhizophagus irregularis TaxID=588596 RepID=A0A2I1HC23_9GLOM|nr:hypothetical protein RhiirA4_476716 [Rhizophagus irregularis]CAB4431853.1 unnamed protein product [Rhizophagus irregularis]
MSMPDTNNNNSSGQEQSLETSVRVENSPVIELKELHEKAEGSTSKRNSKKKESVFMYGNRRIVPHRKGKKTLETEVLPDKRNVLQPSRVR